MYKLILILTALLVGLASARPNPYLREFPADGALEFKLEDKLHLPAFAWPRTLLNYAVRFPRGRMRVSPPARPWHRQGDAIPTLPSAR